ncbi:MAG: hypothetical protein EAZ76_18580 [Nostocales cyanobacterium]|nr:MAG: hypothetical protein EAZ76_18580 [Nostocales cyanobacterium]
MLASKALEDWQLFADNFDNCVQWGNNEYGFQVEKSSFEKFIFKKDVVKDYEQLKTPNKTRKLACDVLNVKSKSPEKQKIIQETKQQWIKALAEELKTTKLPDNWKGQLVVVAENVAEEVLQHDVWRGISDRVAHNNESGVWKEIQETPVEEITKKYPKLNLILTVILISFLVILVVFSLSQSPKNPTPQPKSEPTIVEPSPTPTTSSEPEIQPSPTPTTSAEPEIKPNSHPESQSSTETPTQSDSSNQEIPKTSSIQEEQLDRENNSPT